MNRPLPRADTQPNIDREWKAIGRAWKDIDEERATLARLRRIVVITQWVSFTVFTIGIALIAFS